MDGKVSEDFEMRDGYFLKVLLLLRGEVFELLRLRESVDLEPAYAAFAGEFGPRARGIALPLFQGRYLSASESSACPVHLLRG